MNKPERSGLLIVEDEGLVAMLIEDVLNEANVPVFAVAGRVAQAIELIRAGLPEGALLDVNVAGEQVFPLARMLAAKGVPFLFLTGYGDARLPPEFTGRPVLHKPLAVSKILLAVEALRAKQDVQE
jgi:DNA-binding response OmpR family regulator